MSYIPTPQEALEILKQYNKEKFHLDHAETVSKVMGQSSQAALFLCVKGGGELGCAAGCALQMVQ